MLDFRFIDADSHVAEHPSAWGRVQREYGDRAPHVVENPPELGKGLWIINEGLPPVRSAYFALGHVVEKPQGIGNIAVMEDPQEFRRRIVQFNEGFRYEDYPSGWEPSARIKDMDRDGVEAELIFSSPTRFNYAQTDARFQRAIFRSYNEWLLDFCSYDRKRFVPLPLISVLDVELAVEDMAEYARWGAQTVQIPTQIIGSGYYETDYEPLWDTADETGLVLTVHSGSSQNQTRPETSGPRKTDPTKQLINMGRPLPAVEFISNLIFSGVFDRHPNLRVVCSEFDVSWVGGVVQRLDYAWARESTYDPERNVVKMKPSEYFRRNIWLSFEDDRAGVLTTPLFGEDNFMWGSDFPHHSTTWPHSHEVLEANCAGLDPSLPRKLGRENVNWVYKLGL